MNAKQTTTGLITFLAPLLILLPMEAAAQGRKAEPIRKGFDTAPAAKRKAVVPAVVVPDAGGDAHPVRSLEVNRGGTASTDKLTPKVETVELWSNGVMRWKFSMFNPTEQDRTTDLKFQLCNLVDTGGNRIASVANEFTANGPEDHRLEVQAGTKAPFWIEFPAPKKPMKTFRVFLIVHPNFGAPFKPFSVTLGEEIGPIPDEAAVKPGDKAEAEEAPATETLSASVKAFTARSLNYAGTARLKSGVSGPVTFSFEGIPGEGSPIRARMSSSRLPELTGTLTGRILEDEDSASGLNLVLIGQNGVTYRLAAKGKVLTGTDTGGGSFSLLAK
jgi:hypothetical protein